MLTWHRLALATVMGLPILGLCRASEGPGSDKAPDWSGYVTVTKVIGEVVKADAKSLTLRITWYVPEVKRSGNGNRNRGRRPNLGGGNQSFKNPLMRGRSSGVKVTWKEEHHDYDLQFTPETLVRFKALPPRLDTKGEKMPFTLAEKDALRKPLGVPGYRATEGDLVPGSIVEVTVVRERSVSKKDATERDLRVKYAVILGQNPNPLPPDARKKK